MKLWLALRTHLFTSSSSVTTTTNDLKCLIFERIDTFSFLVKNWR